MSKLPELESATAALAEKETSTPVPVDGAVDRRRLAYLCLEAPREGQASYVHVHEIIAGLRRRGWTITLYAPSYSKQWRRPPLRSRILHYILVQARLMVHWGRHDVVYIRSHPGAFFTALLSRLTGKLTVQEINGPYEDIYISYPAASRWRTILDWSQRQQFRWASALVAVTDRLSNWLRQEVKGAGIRVETIGNGANIEMFHPAAATTRQLPSVYAVFCGGLTQWHGVDTMVAAASHPDWPRGVPLLIVGDGVESATVNAAAAKNPLILPLGRVAYNEVPGIIAKAAVSLVTIGDPRGRSTFCGLSPLKLYEPAASGVPVIVTDLPGLTEFVQAYDCGLIVPVDDPAALARAVAAIVADPARAKEMGARGHAAVIAEHSWDSRAAATNGLLVDMLARNVNAG